MREVPASSSLHTDLNMFLFFLSSEAEAEASKDVLVTRLMCVSIYLRSPVFNVSCHYTLSYFVFMKTLASVPSVVNTQL